MNYKRGNEVSGRYKYYSKVNINNPSRDHFNNNSKFGFDHSRKGQVTVFIIIGIVLLFTFAAILFLTRSTAEEKLTAEGEPVVREAPTEFKPIQTYTENCLRQIGKRGLLILGEQGGYIYPELMGEYSVSEPTDSVGLNLEPLKIPYWHYNAEPNTADKITFATLQPALHYDDDPEMSVEAQLARFVEERLDACLDGYSPFVRQDFNVEIIDSGEIVVKVTDNNIHFWLKRDMKVSKGEGVHEFNQFFVKIPLELKRYYEIADKITRAQREYSFLESHGLELISVYSGRDPLLFPPISDVAFDYVSVLSWDESILKQRFKQLLSSYVPMLRFLGSGNFYYFAYPGEARLSQKVLDNMVIPLAGAEDLDVSFDYQGWEPYFKTNSRDGKITPEHLFVKAWVLRFGQQRYETHYDASFPVLLTISDETGLDGEQYQFAIALEGNIRNNRFPTEEEPPEPYRFSAKSMECNPEQYRTGLLKTVVVDSFSKEPVELVKIGFTIPEQTECDMGLTDSRGELESKYPAVYGGIINFIHQDYLTNFYPIDTEKYENRDALIGYAVEGVTAPPKVVEMHQIKSVKVKVQKKELKKCVTPLHCKYTAGVGLVLLYKDISCERGESLCFFESGVLDIGEPAIKMEANSSRSGFHNYYFNGVAVDLAENEQAFITLERVGGFNDEVLGEEFFSSFTLKGRETEFIDLVPGIYKVTGNLKLEQELVIPSDERCFDYNLFQWKKQTCQDFEESVLENFMSGNINWDSEETYLALTPEDLYTSEEITFYLPSQDLASVPEKIPATEELCGGFLCVAGVCSFQGCDTKNIQVAGRVIEDLTVSGMISDLSKKPEFRRQLEPKYN